MVPSSRSVASAPFTASSSSVLPLRSANAFSDGSSVSAAIFRPDGPYCFW